MYGSLVKILDKRCQIKIIRTYFWVNDSLVEIEMTF